MPKKEPTLDITISDILNEISKINQLSGSEGFSVHEMSCAMGRSRDWCRVQLRKLIDTGKVVCSGSKPTVSIDGRSLRSPSYRMVK